MELAHSRTHDLPSPVVRALPAGLLALLSAALALVWSGNFEPAFSAPKTAILLLGTTLLAALALGRLAGSNTKLRAGYGWQKAFWIAAFTLLGLSVASSAWALLTARTPGWICFEGLKWQGTGLLLTASAAICMDGPHWARRWRWVMQAMAGSGAVVAALTLAQFAGVGWPVANAAGRMRLAGTLGNPDFVGTLLAMAVPLAICLHKNGLGRLWLLAAGTMLAAIALTGSRTAALALVVGVAALAWFKGQSIGWRRATLAGSALAVLMGCTLLLNARGAWESLQGRATIWQVTLQDQAATRALGSGPASFAREYPALLGKFLLNPGHAKLQRFAGAERHAQNDFVEAWHDTGWLGLLALLAFLATWFGAARQRLQQSDPAERLVLAAAIAGVAALCTASLFDFAMHRAESWGWLGLLLAVPLTPPALKAIPTDEQAKQRLKRNLCLFLAALVLVAGGLAGFATATASHALARGLAAEEQADPQAACQFYSTALTWQPWLADAHFAQVRAMAETGNFEGALLQITTAVRYVPEPELYLLQSRLEANAGHTGKARLAVEVGLALFPYSKELRAELGRLLQDERNAADH